MRPRIVDVGGVKKIEIDGVIREPLAFRSFRPEERNISEFYRAGVRLMSVMHTGQNCTLDVPYSRYGEIWTGIGQYDFERLDRKMKLFIDNAPGAYFNVMFEIDTKDWYLEQNPECSDSYYNLVEMAGYQKWRTDTARFLTDALEYVEANYGGKVFAYTLFCGSSTEWYTNSQGNGKPEALLRYHPVKEACFAEWLGDPDAKLPDELALSHTTNGIFRDPVQDRAALDYWKFHHGIIADAIIYFADVFQRAIDHQKLLGLYYGYLNTLKGKRLLHEGHLAYERVWRSSDIDMIFSPAKYGDIRGFDGPSGYLTTVDSIGLNGKLNFQEIDHTTYIAPQTVENGRRIPGSEAKLKDSFSTRMVLRREFVLTRAKRTALWWFDFFGGYYYAPELMDEVAMMVSVQEKLADVPMESVSEIAVLGDTGSMYYPSVYSLMSDDLLVNPPDQLARIGAPYDIYTLSDICHEDFPFDRYKMYIFLNAFKLEDAYRTVIDQKITGSGNTILWIYAPGYITDDGFSTSAVSEVVGMGIGESDGVDSTVDIPAEGLFGGLQTSETAGFAERLFPLFSVDDSEAEVLGTYRANQRAAVARKDCGTWTSVYSAVGNLPANVYREIARSAGVHIYYEGPDPVYINSRLIGIHMHRPGDHVFRLPSGEATSFEELFDGGSAQKKNGILRIPFQDGYVKLFLASDTLR